MGRAIQIAHRQRNARYTYRQVNSSWYRLDGLVRAIGSWVDIWEWKLGSVCSSGLAQPRPNHMNVISETETKRRSSNCKSGWKIDDN